MTLTADEALTRSANRQDVALRLLSALAFDEDGARRPGHLALSTLDRGTWRTDTPPLDEDVTALVERALAHDQAGKDVYIRAGLLREPLPPHRRGGAADSAGLVALVADLDVAGPGHAARTSSGLPLPATEDDALRIIDDRDLPEPTFMFWTGGGWHVWWILDRHAPMSPADAGDISRRWAEMIGHRGWALGWHVDPVGDLARVLRVPGTHNHKPAHPTPPVVEIKHEGPRHALDTLTACLPPVRPTPKPAPAKISRVDVEGDAQDVVEAWTQATPWDDLLIPAGWTAGRDNGSGERHWTRPGKTLREGNSAITHEDPPVMVNFSSAADLPVGTGQKLTKFRVFAELHHGGDQKAAFRAIAPPRAPVAPAASFVPTDGGAPAGQSDEEVGFWEERKALSRIRDFARARRTSPWAVLGVVLVRVTAAVPADYVLPPLVGGYGSLNTFVGIVAHSGGGKGAAERAAADAVAVPPTTTVGVGSGEGIQHQYVARRKDDETGEWEMHQHTETVIFTVAEVDTLAALKGRQGSTLLPELRKTWSGEELGNAYVDPTKRLIVGAHRYRMGLVVGIQPGRAAVLLDDADGGTPQRFLWMPATDPHAPDVRPAEPAPLVWTMPGWPIDSPFGRVDGFHVLDVCRTAVDEIDAARLAQLRGTTAHLDGHALFARLKVAAALGILDGRPQVRDDDWELAGVVMAVSDRTRREVADALAADAADRNRRRGLADADRAVVTEERVADAAVTRTCQAIVRKLTAAGAPVKGSDVRRSLTSRDRPHFDEAVERLIGAGQVEAQEITYQGQAGRMLRLTGGGK